jgi:hypothetical protein
MKSKRLKLAGHVQIGEMRKAYKILVGKTLGKQPLGGQRRNKKVT